MASQLDTITQLLEAVEQKGEAFLRNLAAGEMFEWSVGRVKIIEDEPGRAYLLPKANGLPVWFEILLKPTNGKGQEIALGVDFPEYEVRYAQLRSDQIVATRQKRKLGLPDALEALVLAELVKDEPVAEALVFRLAKEFPAATELMLPLLGLGSARIRSAIGRVIALQAQPDGLAQIADYIEEEPAEGVRAELIMVYLQVSARQNFPNGLVDRWLASPHLSDVLSCLASLSALGHELTPRHLNQIKPHHRSRVAGWFAAERVEVAS